MKSIKLSERPKALKTTTVSTNGSANAPADVKAEEVGPGADRALFEYIEAFRWSRIGVDCSCRERGRCLHSNALSSLAREMFWNFVKFEPEKYRKYEMPPKLKAFRKNLIAKSSAYETLQETIIGMLPKAKRGRLRGLMDRYQRELEDVQGRFFVAVGYVRGITDHEDLTNRRLAVIENLLRLMKDKRDRPFYDRVYLSPWFDLTKERLQEIMETDVNHVQPGLLAFHRFWERAFDLDHAADDIARQFEKTKDPKLLIEKLRSMEASRRLRDAQEKLHDWD